MPAPSSHAGGGSWPGGLGGIPSGLSGGKYLFGPGTYSGNILQNCASTALTHYCNNTYGGAASNVSDGNTTTYVQQYTYCAVNLGAVRTVKRLRVFWHNAEAATAANGQYVQVSDNSTNGSDGTWTTIGTFSGQIAGWNTIDLSGNTLSKLLFRVTGTGTSSSVLDEWEIYTALDEVNGTVTITKAAIVLPDPESGAAVVTCKNLVLDGATANLTAATNCKGLIVFASESVVHSNGAKSGMSKLGKAGNFGNLTVLDLVPAALKRKLKNTLASYIVLGDGALGGLGSNSSSPGSPGQAASGLQTGGGGGGATGAGFVKGGDGKRGGPCCGGAGGGAGLGTGKDATDYGGPGGYGSWDNSQDSASGGVGNPPGNNTGNTQRTTEAPGGLCMFFTPSFNNGSGCIISSDGGKSGDTYSTGGGGGGGIVFVLTLNGGYTNNGTIRANGGVAGTGTYVGGVGGLGTVYIVQI